MKHPTHILAATLRAFYETVTSSCVIGPWMLWGVFLFLVASIEPSQSVGMPTRPSPTQILDDNPAKRYPCKAPIAWENLTDGCQFVDGVAPTWLKEELQHIVELQPGQHTDFLVAPHEMARVVALEGGVAEQQLELWLSDGSGLMRKLNTAMTRDGQALIVAPDYPAWTIARVQRPAFAEGCRRFKIYTSRRDVKRGLDSYQCELFNCGEKVEIRNDSVDRPRSYYVVEANSRIKLANRKADSRVRFETRLDYNRDRTQHRSYWMKVLSLIHI